MDKCKTNLFVSVDSETGIYWDGEHPFRTQSWTNATNKQSSAENYAARGQALFCRDDAHHDNNMLLGTALLSSIVYCTAVIAAGFPIVINSAN